MQEIEMKLRMTPAALQRLRRHPIIRSLARGRSHSRTLSSIYYDTPEGFFVGAGMALRIRRDGSTLIQTLKAPAQLLRMLELPEPARADSDARTARIAEETGADDAFPGAGRGAEMAENLSSGLQSFTEFECPLEQDAPDLDLIGHEGLRRHLQANQVGERLVPLFLTAFERRSLELGMAESRIELALDQGEIRAGDGEEGAAHEPLCEAELELKAGRPERLFELALLLAEKLEFQLEPRTKPARGYALLAPVRPEPVFATKVELPRDVTGAGAFEAMATNALIHMRANEPALRLGEDPSALHQYRVGLRRLRALVSLSRDYVEPQTAAFLSQELRWVQQTTGPARDWDVFLLETLAPLRERLPAEPGLEPLTIASEAARAADHAEARALLDSARYSRLLLRMQLLLHSGAWRRPPTEGKADPLDAPARELASRLLGHRAAKLNKLGRGHKTKSESELHEIRIAAKKLRYAVDFFRSLYPAKKVKPYAARLKDLQDRLGSLNDAAVGHQLIDSLRAAGGNPHKTEIEPLAAGLVIGWQAARIENDLPRFSDTWKAYRSARPFWK